MVPSGSFYNFLNIIPKMTILLDNGHGKETLGKRSPIWKNGSQLLEWEFNRDIVNRIIKKCSSLGIPTVKVVPEDEDISLSDRCKRINSMAKQLKGDCLLLSIHANAGGGTGWEVWTSPGKTKSDDYATIFWKTFKEKFPDFKMRSDLKDGDVDKEENFYILTHSSCPAILTENFFMDNENDCKFILSEDGRERIADGHVASIQKFI